MAADSPEASDESLIKLFPQLQAGEEHDTVSEEIIDIVRRISHLMVYIKGMWHEEQQRRFAEAQVFSLKMQLFDLFQQYHGSIDMLVDMSHPPLVHHH